jgi:hypothetical protein
MNLAETQQRLMTLEHRVGRVEQILPTLLTRSEFQTALEGLRAEMAGMATKDEMRAAFAAHSAEIRRHFDVVAESLRDDIRLLAEGHGYVIGRLDRVDQRLDGVDQRLNRVDQRLDGVDQRLDRVDQRLGNVDQRLDRVAQGLERIERRP